ncbi:methanol dehydrogenase [Siphonobacter curvatus]|uniref:Methanol dehydrogenase n=2 Tax=Siphonobacter curvatus TaxID=2094562 RepID=A0A2S7ILB8_9BACT|nr:methanol dehydrogenase [Siphonobacter curvatus]
MTHMPFLRVLRKGLWLVFSILSFVVAFAQDIPERPVPARFVNDYVGMLAGGEKDQLERKLKGFMDSTSNQIVIVIVKTTGDYPPGDYAFQIGRKWGIGQKDKDNGLVLLWATETRKLYIAPGYGLEGAIPDAVAKRIISDQLAPAFKQQQYFKGLDNATSEIIRRASGEYKNDQASDDTELPMSGVIIFLVIAVVGFIVIARLMGRGCRNSGGTGGGMPWFVPYATMSSWGSSSGSWGGSSGGGGGGGWDFGGGSFGGGGAGGDY